MPEFKLQFTAGEIRDLAARFAYADDRECRLAGVAARTRGHYRRDEFLTICAWKTDRSRPKVARNDAATVERATRIALSSQEERRRMEALVELEGVGVPTAS